VGTLAATLIFIEEPFVSSGSIFGYVNPVSRSSGTLINRNHFAGLMEMFIPTALGLAYMSARRFGGIAALTPTFWRVPLCRSRCYFRFRAWDFVIPVHALFLGNLAMAHVSTNNCCGPRTGNGGVSRGGRAVDRR